MMNRLTGLLLSIVLIYIAVLGVLVSPIVLTAAPSQVWVSLEYEEGTDGWGVTRFSAIQEGVNAVAGGGTVNVAAGTYLENVVIEKSLSLLGDDADTTTVEVQDSGHCVSVEGTTGVSISGFTFIGSGEDMNPSLNLIQASDTSITNNRILETGIGLQSAHNNNITNNYFDSKDSIVLYSSWGNHIEGNEIHAHYPESIALYTKSNNNVILDNTIIGSDKGAPCTGARFVLSSNNLFVNNTIHNFRVHILLTYCHNSIVANNSISQTRGGNPLLEDGGGMVLYHATNNVIINNNISSVVDAGICLFGFSSNNTVRGNQINDTEQAGIELHYQSDNNLIANNTISKNSFGIILDDTSNNKVYQNNIIESELGAYDNGNNIWDYEGEGNYWSDYEGVDEDGDDIGDTPRDILTEGTDQYPIINRLEVVPLEVPELELALFEEESMRTYISDQRRWENETIDLGSPVWIEDGGSLTLNNVTLQVAFDDLLDVFKVYSGGTLEIYNSKIYGQGQGILIDKGAIFHIEDSELYGLGHWDGITAVDIYCNGAVVKNNIIRDAYTGITIREGSSKHQIVGNKISNVRNGIYFTGGATSVDNIIDNNEISYVISEAMRVNAFHDSNITNNVFQDIWGNRLFIMGASGNTIYGNTFMDCDPAEQDVMRYAIFFVGTNLENTIYGNNFNDCVYSVHDEGNNQWFYESEGNYWSDYQERYPNAWENAEHKGVWDTPYAISGGNNEDLYPLMPLTPLVKTEQVTSIMTDSATLSLDFIVGDYHPVQVHFEYRKAGETDWVSTTSMTYDASGSHLETITGLELDMGYEFRAYLTYDDITISGDQLNFTTLEQQPEVSPPLTEVTTSTTPEEKETPLPSSPTSEEIQPIERDYTLLTIGIIVAVVAIILVTFYIVRKRAH